MKALANIWRIYPIWTKTAAIVAVAFASIFLSNATAAERVRPQLIVVISVDQLCYEYLHRFREGFHDEGLFRAIERQGASFDNCHHRHAFTFTGTGHGALLTGAYPESHGIIGNEWFDRASGDTVNCVSDAEFPVVGTVGSDEGISPRNLRVSTLGDVLKLSTAGKAKVFGVAMKDRAAVIMGGHSADAAFWFDDKSGNWVTSRYYRDDLPGYLRVINESGAAEKYAGQTWNLLHDRDKYHHYRPDDSPHERPRYGMTNAFPHKLPAVDDPNYYAHMSVTPFGNELTLLAAEEIVTNEQLGLDEMPDLLCVGLSSNDYVGHSFGPHSLEVEDMVYRTDVQLGQFILFLKRHLGDRPWVLAVSSDHGIPPIPEYAKELKLPAERDPLGDLGQVEQELEKLLRTRIPSMNGTVPIVQKVETNQVYLHDAGGDDTFNRAQRVVRDWLLQQSCVAAAVTREQLLSSDIQSSLESSLRRAFDPKRSGDVLFVLKPYHIHGPAPTTHGTPWHYDTHVPLLLLGTGIRPGHYNENVSPAALAPTLARLLDIDAPPASVEMPLDQALGK